MSLLRWVPGILLATTIGLASCGKSGADEEVVLYYSADSYVAEPIIERFESETGILVRASGDTEATKTTGLASRLRSESGRPRADVFWSSEVFLTLKLADEGVLAPFESEQTAAWPEAFRDPERGWYGFGTRARVVVYNEEVMGASEAPRTMHDLLDSRYKDRVVMARPQFGTTRGHMAFLVAAWGADEARTWMEGMATNGVRLVDGNATVVEMVARGEAHVGLTDTDDVWSGQRNDWPVAASFVRHDLGDASIGQMVIPNTVARVSGGPNPEAAAKLIDFLLSEDVERMLAESDSHNIPIRPELKKAYAEWSVDDPAEVPYAEIADAMQEAMRLCEEALGSR